MENPRTYIDDRPVAVSRSFSFYCALFFFFIHFPSVDSQLLCPGEDGDCEHDARIAFTKTFPPLSRPLHRPPRSPDRPSIATRRIIRPTFSKKNCSQNNSLSAFYSGNQLFLVTQPDAYRFDWKTLIVKFTYTLYFNA